MDAILVIARAISCPTRLFILQLVGEAGLSVTQVARQATIPPSTACHHLGVLLHAGLVERVRRGHERVYRWGPERVSLVVETVPQSGHEASKNDRPSATVEGSGAA